jgi:hypothetical protein
MFYNLIRNAIINKQQVIATYNGYVREMCPHVLGLKNGRQHALFYQFAGGSSKGLDPSNPRVNWRCVFVDELSNVSVREGLWHSADNHSRPQTCVGTIDVEVDIGAAATGR